MSSEKASSSKETITNKSTVSSAPDQSDGDSINVGDIEGMGIAIGTGAIATVNNHYHYYTQAQLQQQFSPRVLELQLAAVSAELDRLSSDFSEKVTTELEEIRELERKGQIQSSRARTEKLQRSENWRIFTKPLQAKVLRMLAGYAITLDDDPSQAIELLDQAHLLDPEADTTFIRTLIRFRTDGIEAALAEINNISDISIVNLKLALLLEINRADEAIATIQTIPENIQPNAGTYRLHALALLMNGNIPEAQQKIQEAVAANPDWETVREVEALINYHSALSPVALPKHRFPLPEPVDSAFVKHDGDSLERLRKAEAAFNNLASETERADEVRDYWKIWRLACLANDPERQDEAQKFCQALLEEDPDNTKAIVWAIARNYEVDLAASQKALEASLETSENSREAIERITVLLWLYLNSKNFQDALKLLERTREQFEQQRNIDYWLFWYAQALVADEKLEEALQEVDTLPSLQSRRILRTLVLREIAVKSGHWQPVIEHLETCFQETHDSKFLYECCYLKAYLQDWSYVADRSEVLLEKIGTPAVLELAVDCTRRAGRPAQCVKLLNGNQNLFSQGVLPHYLRHLKIWCLAQIGSINEAVAEAESLVQEQETANYLVTLMAMQFRQGDMHGMVITARRLSVRDDVLPINLLQAARLIQPENLRLARQLWQQAVTEPVEPKILGEVIDVGFKLSLDSELRPFLYQAQLLAHRGEGPFKAVPLNEVISLQQNWVEHTSELSQKYDRGELPIHLIAEAGRFPLVNLFRNLLQKNSAALNPHRQPSVLTRYGGRPVPTHPLPEEFTSSLTHWQLHLDISAFLLADYLEILEPLERCFKPLRISAAFPPALARQLQMLQSHQPSRLKLYQQSLDLVQRGVLKELPRQLDALVTPNKYLVEKMGERWSALLERAKKEAGYLVDFLPLERLTNEGEFQPVSLLEEERERIINCRALLESLKQNNLLTDSQYQTALVDLGEQGYPAFLSSLPPLDVPIFLMDGTASVLAEAKILKKICQCFQVFVDYTYLEEARIAVSSDEQRSNLIKWLTDLMERVRDGLDRHNYETITLPDSRAGQELERDAESNLDLLTAWDLFRFESKLNDVIDVIWIDDRFFNRCFHRGDGIQIITIVEVLDALLALDELSQDDYYDKLLHLRKANVRYIPITSKEIIYWLKRVRVINGAVKESEPLAVLRRYMASCLLDTHRLQLPYTPENSPNPQGEITFLLSCIHAFADTIVAGWLDDSVSNEYAVAYANWILINLYTGTFGTRHISPASDSNSNWTDLIGLDISSLYIGGIQLWREKSNDSLEEQSSRQHYFTWLDWQVAERRFKANPEAETTTAQAIHFLLAEQSKAPKEDKLQDQFVRYIHQQFYYDLPTLLCTEIESDSKLMNWLGIQTTPSITIDSLSLPATEFWQATEAAINGREATITALEPQIELKIQRASENPSRNILEIRSQDSSIVQGIDDALFQLLSDNPSQRAEVLRSRRFWLDCDNETLEQVISEIISVEEPRARFERAKAWRNQSAAFFYKALKLKLNHTNRFDIDDLMPPSAEGLLRHFRLEATIKNGDDFHTYLNQAAQSLILEEGIEEALERLAGLPIKLPPVVLDELNNLTPEERQHLLKRLADSWASPVCKLQLIDLALGCIQEGEAVIELVQNSLDDLYSEAAVAHFNLFSVLLQLVNNAFSFRTDIKEWSVPVKLAMIWGHTSRLQNLLDVPGLKLQEFTDNLWASVQSQVNPERLNRNPEFWDDVLHPHRLDHVVLTVHGLASLLRDKSPEVLNQAGGVGRIRAFAVKVVEEHQIPNPQLFRDSMLARDSLKSILGGDRGHCLTPFLGSELTQYLESASLRSIIEGAIQNLKSDPTALVQWSWLDAVVGDLPIYEDLKEPLKKVIGELNIAALFKIKPELALLALNVASHQINYLGDDKVRSHLDNQLIHLAEVLAEQDGQENVDESTIALLIETIFRLCVRPRNPRETSQSAAELLIRVLNTWQQLADTHIYACLFKLIQEFPTEQLHGFWKAFLHLRALRGQQA